MTHSTDRSALAGSASDLAEEWAAEAHREMAAALGLPGASGRDALRAATAKLRRATALADLDGSDASAVALLAGLTRAELDEVGGVEDHAATTHQEDK